MPIQVLPTDHAFHTSPDAGAPDCLCSRCSNLIQDIPVRIFPAPGTTPEPVTEYRYCPQCVLAECGKELPDIDTDDNDDDPDIPDIFGYECLCCGHVQDHDGECDRCTAYSMEPMYF